MKQFYKIALMFVIGTALNFTYGQVQVNINDVMVNYQTTVTNCNTIDFGTTTNNNLSFSVTLIKPSNMVVGTGTLKVMFKYDYSYSGSQIGAIVSIPDNWSNNTQIGATINADIFASNIKVSGSSVYVEYESSGGVKYTSCEYPLIKTPPPTFTLSSSVNSIDCGTSTPVAFTITNVHNSPGYWEYLWNVGSGWNMSGTFTTTTNTISLIPVSYPLGQVKVTPIRNNHYYSQLSKSIGLNSFRPSISFQGNTVFCSTGTYTVDLSGVPSNVITNWSISANNTANIVSSTNTSVTINVYSNTGKFDLTANVVNSCGQSRTFSRRFWVGAPRIYHDNDFFDADLGTPESMILCQNYLHDDNNKKTIFTNGLDLGSQWEFQSLSNNFYWSRDNNVIYFRPYQLGAISFKVRVSNSSCGWSDWVTYNMTVISCTPFNPPSMKSLSQKTYKAYPNPSNDVVYIELKDTENPPLAETRITGKLYDLMGNLKSNVQIINNQAMFSVQGLNTGIYVLRIDIDGTIESHNIAVE